MERNQELFLYDLKCVRLLREPEITFAGLIDRMGKLVAGGFKHGIVPIEDEAERQKMYSDVVLRASLRKDFDYSLGPVMYSASRRESCYDEFSAWQKSIACNHGTRCGHR